MNANMGKVMDSLINTFDFEIFKPIRTAVWWITKPFRAWWIGMGYVLRGEYVDQPIAWKDI